MRLLAISGSLRKASLNTAVLRAAVRLAPPNLEVSVYGRLGDLPLYDFDLDSALLPAPVRDLRAAVDASDGLVIASPEYAHGISGPMKNALDWLVGSIGFPNKPIALWNCAPRAVHAQAHLREVLTTMSARLLDEASLALPLLGSNWTADAIAESTDYSRRIAEALRAFESHLKVAKGKTDDIRS